MNTQQRTEQSLKNLSFAMVGQVLGIIISIIARIVFVRTLSAEYLGVSGLFTNVISILSLVELGIGPALIYSLYQPLAEKNIEMIKSLMKLYRKAYMIIGFVIIVFGMIVTPFIHVFIKDMPNIANIQFIFFLFVLNAAVSYFYSYKRSLIIADQKKYIDIKYRYSFFILLNIFQCIVLLLWKDFILFVICQLLFTIIENILASKAADKLFPFLKSKDIVSLDKLVLKDIVKNVKAMSMHKIGTIIVVSTDNILISSFVGIIAVGLYSNYRLILVAINIVLIQFFEAVKSSVGNLGVTESKEKTEDIFCKIFFMNFWLFGFAAICLLTIFNPFIELWVGKKFSFPMEIVLLIVINFYLGGMRQSALTFRDALGLYWFDRYKPIAESIINLAASIILLKMMGIGGIFLGTIISILTTCFWVEPFVLYKYGFHSSSSKYFRMYIKYMLVTVIAGIITYSICRLFNDTNLLTLIAKLLISIILPNLVFYLLFRKSAEFIYFKGLMSSIVGKVLKRNKMVEVKNM